jgi:hypothetical protein
VIVFVQFMVRFLGGEAGGGPDIIVLIRLSIQIGKLASCISLSVLWGAVLGVEKTVARLGSTLKMCSRHIYYFLASNPQVGTFPLQGGQ